MSDFDPFSESSEDFSGYKDKGNSNSKKKITQILKVIVFVAIVFFLSKYLFFNNADIQIDVNDLSNNPVNAQVIIAKDKEMNDIVERFQTNKAIKSLNINKGKYYYSASATGYIPKKQEFIEIRENKTININLAKDTKLELTNLTHPTKIFRGQTIYLKADIKNTSPNITYSADEIEFTKDLEDWEKSFVSLNYEDLKNPPDILPKKEMQVVYKIKVPIDEEIEEKDIKLKIKGTNQDIENTLEIIDEPELNIDFDFPKTIESGEEEIVKYTIKNESEENSISIKFKLDINSENNENIENWFNIPKAYINIKADDKKTDNFDITVPENAVNDKISGKIIIDSELLSKPKEIPLEIEIKEPEINFDIDLSKNQVTLDYDINSQTTNQEYIDLDLSNSNNFTIDIQDMYYIYSTGIDDCNKWITLPQNFQEKILKDSKNTEIIDIRLKNKEQIDSFTNNSRVCKLVVVIKHPFREDEFIEYSKNLTIFVEEKT